MKTVDPNTLLQEGCDEGLAAPSTGSTEPRVILDFGQPLYDSSRGYGVYSFDNNYHSAQDVDYAVLSYAFGYHDCAFGVSPTPIPPKDWIRITVGVNNLGSGTTYHHGQQWGTMQQQLQSQIGALGLSPRVMTDVGSDIEMNWNSAAVSRAWVDGVDSVTWAPLDYGDAAGCPPYGSCNNGWTQEDLWYVGGGGPSDSMPEIYYNANAQEWGVLNQYSVNNHGYSAGILGPLTEYAADSSTNTPQAGWDDLFNQLTYYCPNRTIFLQASTDITHAN